MGVDLSPHMLAVAGEKARRENLAIERVLANIVELNALADQMADYVICMFATLGMIAEANGSQLWSRPRCEKRPFIM